MDNPAAPTPSEPSEALPFAEPRPITLRRIADFLEAHGRDEGGYDSQTRAQFQHEANVLREIADAVPAVPLTSGSEGEPTFDYPAAARSLHLNLREFCDESEPFPLMVANAGRKAATALASARAALDSETATVKYLLTELGSVRSALDAKDAECEGLRANLDAIGAENVGLAIDITKAEAALDAKDAREAELRDHIEQLRRERDAARIHLHSAQSALDEAKRDTERLDWLRQQSAVVAGVEEGNVVLRFVPVGSPGEDSFTTEGDGWSDIFVGSTLNDAIDAARSASPVQEQTPASRDAMPGFDGEGDPIIYEGLQHPAARPAEQGSEP